MKKTRIPECITLSVTRKMLIKIRVGEIKPTVMGKCEFEKQQKSVLVAFFWQKF